MTYRLADLGGDSIAVPQLVFHSLARTGGDHVRVALYILATHSTDAREIAGALGLKSTAAAQKALDYWHGVGLLTVDKERSAAAAQPEKAAPLTADELRIAALHDSSIKTLVNETQMILGRSFSHRQVQQLVALYVNEAIPVDVILLCASYTASEGRTTIAQLESELTRWLGDGVVTGADAEAHLALLQARKENEQLTAKLFNIPHADLTMAEKNCIRRWFESYHYNVAMIEEAMLHAGANKDIKYTNGILKNWHAKGWHTVQDTRGAGQLSGSNVRVDRPTHSGSDILAGATRRPLRLKREE